MNYTNFDNRLRGSVAIPESRRHFLRELEDRLRRDRERRRAERVASRDLPAKSPAGGGLG